MSSLIVFAVYGASALLAFAVLYYFGPTHWYWHAAGLVLAIVLGLTPIPAKWQGPAFDLATGFVFLFLVLWGVAAPLVRMLHRSQL